MPEGPLEPAEPALPEADAVLGFLASRSSEHQPAPGSRTAQEAVLRRLWDERFD